MSLDSITQSPWYLYLQNNPDWIYAFMAFIAFIESLALVGVAVPGVMILAAVSVLAGHAGMPLPGILLAAFIGAVLGDQISFFIGRFYHAEVKRLPPFRNHPGWIQRSEVFFQQHGAKSVVIGRFIGPIRPIIPMVAGMFDMPPRRFITVNVLSALAWAPAYLLPAYYGGTLLDELLANPALLWGGAAAALLIALLVWWRKRNKSQPL